MHFGCLCTCCKQTASQCQQHRTHPGLTKGAGRRSHTDFFQFPLCGAFHRCAVPRRLLFPLPPVTAHSKTSYTEHLQITYAQMSESESHWAEAMVSAKPRSLRLGGLIWVTLSWRMAFSPILEAETSHLHYPSLSPDSPFIYKDPSDCIRPAWIIQNTEWPHCTSPD